MDAPVPQAGLVMKRTIWNRLEGMILPERATTQTWMILTFALFVGVTVAGVGLYTAFVLRGEIQDAAQETLRQEAERAAVLIEEMPGLQDRREVADQISTLTGLHVESLAGNEITVSPLPEVHQAIAGDSIGFDVRENVQGQTVLAVALLRPSGQVIQVAQEEPPLLEVIRKLEATLVVGLALALLAALLGSWIAARQVTRPLHKVTSSARRISEGELDVPIVVRSRAAEFQDLGKSLNTMAARFREDIHKWQRMTQIQNEFIGNVSHEVKNPIFAVYGYLEVLGSDTLTVEQRQNYAQKGLANLERLNNLFSHLIEIAKLEYREDLLHPEVFNLQALVEEVCDTVQHRAEEKGLTMEMQNDPVFVFADRNRMRQVLTNLIENAINYSDEGFVRCRLRRHMDKVRVEVVDTGRGISEEHLDRVFERFYRVDKARSKKAGGTGLGLSIVKQILQAHDEPVHVESTLGRGTRFWFELPWAEPIQPALEAREEEVESEVEPVA